MYINDKENIVLVRKSEYDKLITLAEANEKRIQKLALKMWQEKGIPELQISMEIRSIGGREIEGSERFKFKANTYIYNKEGNFYISEKAKQRFSNMVRDWTYDLMERNFGERLMNVNKWNENIERLNATRKKFKIFTFLGWLMALAMFISLILMTILRIW